MAGPDPLFKPLLTEDEVLHHCYEAQDTGGDLPHVVAHAIAAMRVTKAADPDVTDGVVGRFIRTGEVPTSPTRVWWPLFGPMYSDLPAGMATVATMFTIYLTVRAGRGPVAGWPCAETLLEPTRKD